MLAKSRFWEETFSQSQKEEIFPAADKKTTLICLLKYWCLSYISATNTLTATWAERFISAHRLQSIIAGKSRLQEIETSSHITPKTKSGVMNAHMISAQLIQSTVENQGMEQLTFKLGLPTSVIVLRTVIHIYTVGQPDSEDLSLRSH